MNGEQHLNNRLRLCAEFVRRGAKLADIGTDHAYLPVWLCENGVCPQAIAADVNPEPLSRGRLTVENAGLSGVIETRLSDGLKEIGEDEVDDVVIAGMGGELIAKLIGDCPYSRSPDKHFILQPMTRSESLIAWLCSNGFEIENQDCCTAGGKCYTVLSVYHTGNAAVPDELFFYTGRLHPRENETHLRFIRAHIARLRKQEIGDARFGALAQRLEGFCGEG